MIPLARPQEPQRPTGRGRRRMSLAGFFMALSVLAAALLVALPAQAGQGGRRLALLVGVGNFSDSSFTRLVYARRDAEAMRQWLTSSEGGDFQDRDVTVLLDAQATRKAILREAERLTQEAGPDDLVLLYFSTHGFYTQDKVVGIVCHDTRATGALDANGGPVVYRDQALTRDDLRQFLERLPAARRAVIIDVCHGAQLAGGESPVTAAARFDAPQQGKIFADGDSGQVTLVLASSLGSEKAWESQELQSSIFTYYILEGLKRSGGDLLAAFNLAREETERQSKCEKGVCQTPYLVQQPPDRGLSLSPPRKG